MHLMKAAGIVHASYLIQMEKLHLFIGDNLLVVVGDGDMEMKLEGGLDKLLYGTDSIE